jgi:hypothetical protein
MANQKDGEHRRPGAAGGIDQYLKTAAGSHETLTRKVKRPGRDDTLDEELEAERLEPGLRTGGVGDTGADASHPHDDGNSNT